MEPVRFNWRREILVLGVLGMEAIWVSMWLRFLFALGPTPERFLPLGGCFALLVLATYTVRALGQPYGDMSRRQVLMAALIVGSSLLVIRAGLFPDIPLWNPSWLKTYITHLSRFSYPEVLATLACLGFWWRGIIYANDSFDVESTGFRFRLGVIAFVWLMLITAIIPAAISTSLMLLYFGVALLSMALARVEEASRGHEDVSSPFTRTWLGIVVVTTLVLLTLATGAASLISLSRAQRLLGLLEPLWRLLDRLLYLLILLLVRLLEPFMVWAINWLRSMMQGKPLTFPTPVPTPGGENLLEQGETSLALLHYLEPLRWVVMGVLGIAMLILMVRALRYQKPPLEETVPELRESIWSAEAFAADLRALWRRAQERLRGLAQVPARLRRAYATASIREIYASLCHWAAAHGCPRPAPLTPYEYLPLLIEAFPGCEAELREITEAYIRVRYAEIPASAEDVQRARAAFERILAFPHARLKPADIAQ